MKPILLVPHASCGVINKQLPASRGIFHGYIVFAAHRAAHGVGIGFTAQRLGYLHRQTSVKGADAASRLVKKGLPHDGKASVAAGLYTPAGGVLNLEAGGIAAEHLVNAPLLKEHGIPEEIHRAGEWAVRTDRCGVAVGGDAHIAAPVFEVTQLAGVNFVDGFAAAVFTVPAAPQPVAGLDDEIHTGHPSFHRHTAVLALHRA